MSSRTSRRISYTIPAPSTSLPLLDLPPVGTPRNGRTSPLILPKLKSNNPFLKSTTDRPKNSSYLNDRADDHPRHCLGVAAIALDTTTQLHGKDGKPEGILYTGGRDGLVASWELGLSLKKRRTVRWGYEGADEGRRPRRRVRWERLEEGAAWDEEEDEEDEDEIEEERDDLFNEEDDSSQGTEGENANTASIPFEQRWQVDPSSLDSGKSLPPTVFRQSVQTHTDWVNDLVLCNMNQTVISASSDRTIRSWAPHSSTDSACPSLIGVQRDYAKVLSYAPKPNLLFSGGLDRQIYTWDVHSPRHDAPLLKLAFPEDTSGGPRGSVYALSSTKSGNLVAAGSPERVVRLWDPRVGAQANSGDGIASIAQLIGHTDNIRAVLMSEDGRYLLSGSSDSTIKLWSLAAQRCLHTFTHHADSVWSLFSDHPNLERFYSGDRSGHLCVTDLEGCQTDYNDGECLLLAKEDLEESRRGTEGICQIVGLDDTFVWTATGAASVKRWRDVGKKRDRLEKNTAPYKIQEPISPIGTPPVSSVSPLSAYDAAFPLKNKRLSAEGAGGEHYPLLYRIDSKESRSVSFQLQQRKDDPAQAGEVPATPFNVNGHRRTTSSGTPIANSIFSVDSSKGTERCRNGIPYANLLSLGLPDSPYLGYSYAASTMLVPQGHHMGQHSVSSHHGLARGNSEIGDKQREDFLHRESAPEAEPLRKTPDEIIAGRHGLVRALMLNDRQHVLTADTGGQVALWNIVQGSCVGRFSPDQLDEVYQETGHPDHRLKEIGGRDAKEALEIVREHIEGEAATITWCSVDTRVGSLTVHIEEGRAFDAEIYADEVGLGDDPYFKEDQRINIGKWVIANLFAGLVKAEAAEAVQITPQAVHSALPSNGSNRSPAPTFTALERPLTNSSTPGRRLRSASSLSLAGQLTSGGGLMIGMSTPALTPAILPISEKDEFSLEVGSWKNRAGLPAIPQSVAASPTGFNVTGGSRTPGELVSKGDYFSTPPPKGARESSVNDLPKTPGGTITPGASTSAPTQTSSGSFMGRLKGFGGKNKKAAVETAQATLQAPTVEDIEGEDQEDTGPAISEQHAAQLRLLSAVRSHPFQPPPYHEAPPLPIPQETALLISEESRDAGAWAVTYRGMVSRAEEDFEPLEMAAPGWMLDYLFAGRNRVREPDKLCFILEPWCVCTAEQRLSEMPDGNSRLTANRVLRIRKVLQYVSSNPINCLFYRVHALTS